MRFLIIHNMADTLSDSENDLIKNHFALMFYGVLPKIRMKRISEDITEMQNIVSDVEFSDFYKNAMTMFKHYIKKTSNNVYI